MYAHYVGVDISFKTATIAWQGTSKPTVIEIKQTQAGYDKLIKRLESLGDPSCVLVVMEATGTYWMKLAYTLEEADFAVSVVNPIEPKYFSKMRRQHSKTDAIDAVMLMEFAQTFKPDPWTPPPPICETLRQYLTYRNQLIDFQAQARSQLHAMQQNPHANPDLIQRMEHRLAELTAEIKLFKAQILALLLSESQWAQAAGYLLSIKGIGTITAAWLLVSTHCFARCETPEQAASFAGLAPHAKESGEQQGYRSVGGRGHLQLRNCLYMASAPASRFNPIMNNFSLVANPKKSLDVLLLVN